MHKLLSSVPLSTALRELCNELSVQIISQQITTATSEDLELLCSTDPNCWIRETYLLGDGIPLVQARVIASLDTYHIFKNDLDQLGNFLFGEGFLFRHEHTRSPFQFTRHGAQWRRRSVAAMADHRFVLDELFLNALLP